jgi:single-stranded DNA-binding protein
MIAVTKATLVGASYKMNLSQTKTGRAMLQFLLRTWKPGRDGKDKVMFLPIVAYSASAEILGKWLKDGKLVYLDCTIDQYKSQDGAEKYQFIVEQFTFLGDSKESS